MGGTYPNPTGGGGGGSPGGSDTQVQFNNSGAFGGDSGLIFNKTNDTLSILGSADAKRLLLKAHSSQTANLFEVQDASSNIRYSNGSAGQVYLRPNMNESTDGLLIEPDFNSQYYATTPFSGLTINGYTYGVSQYGLYASPVVSLFKIIGANNTSVIDIDKYGVITATIPTDPGSAHTSTFGFKVLGDATTSYYASNTIDMFRITGINLGNHGIYSTGELRLLRIDDGAGNEILTAWRDGSIIIGTITKTAGKLQIRSTTEQLRIEYDSSNYFKTTVGSTGEVVFDATGSGSAFTYNDSLGAGITPTGNGLLQVKAGSSTSAAKVGGVLFDHYADVGNVGTGEDDLYSDTIAASVLAANGDKIIATYQGIFSGAALSTQELRLYYGGTKIYDSGALAIGVATNSWTAEVVIIRESSSVVRCSVAISTDFATLFPYSTYTRVTGLTLTNTQIIKLTGEAAGAGAANDQVISKLGYVEFKPGA